MEEQLDDCSHHELGGLVEEQLDDCSHHELGGLVEDQLDDCSHHELGGLVEELTRIYVFTEVSVVNGGHLHSNSYSDLYFYRNCSSESLVW